MNRWDIINHFTTKESNYLEIGCGDGECFYKVNAKYREGVDPNTTTHIAMTSDDYFKQNSIYWDVIFIDGLHFEEQADRDIENALYFLNDKGVIILHDCIPNDMKAATEENTIPSLGYWFGTTWRSAVKLAYREDVDFTVIEQDTGCGILKYGKQNLPNVKIENALDPEFFIEHYDKIYRLRELDT